MQTPDPVAYPTALERAEAALVQERRTHAAGGRPAPAAGAASKLPDDAVGFGLSGGGIRSATFSLGVLQSLAAARCLGTIDFLSTVSGGGYAGSFLGRLFTREWVSGTEDVEQVLRGLTPPSQPPGLGARVVRWLRDNGRYLAPRGSGDLLLLGSIALRNWVAVQVVLVTFVLALFVLLQIVRGGLDWLLQRAGVWDGLTGFLVCALPLGNSLFWWSPWIVVCAAVLVVWAVPAGWAYFLVGRDRRGPQPGLHPMWGAVLVLVASVAGVIEYAAGDHPERLALSAAVAGLSALTLGWLAAARRKARASQSDPGGVARNVVSRWLATGIVALAGLTAWTLLDTVARTLYAISTDAQGSSLGAWFGAVIAALAAVGAFARQIGLFVGSKQQDERPGPAFSTVTWVAAVAIVSVWLVSIAVASYAVVWRLEPLAGKPAAIGGAPPPTLLGTGRVLVTPEGGGFVVTAAEPGVAPCLASGGVQQPSWPYVFAAFAFLLLLSIAFGHTRTFANMSSMHAFYAARLTRTFLGASNTARFGAGAPVTETVAGDDLPAERYWRWPVIGTVDARESAPFAWTRGGPLHFVNVTVNETLDAATGIQNQDRKGTGLAIGPTALSLGVRHHLVRQEASVQAFPESPPGGMKVHRVFSTDGWTPEALPLGRWVSISGAAFSTGTGSQTTIPMALLTGMFNVRLGYWWDSGMPVAQRSRFARAFPVQYALFSEALARTRGTADPLWNLSDGGHFENLAGYELIRRRLPIIVIVDAEADPDYTFSGLAELVRKARMDFRAEITFLTDAQLSQGMAVDGALHVPLPASVRPSFGPLEWLRRGRWSDESLPPTGGRQQTRHTIEVDRARVSRAHAALARVEYLDNGDASWLVYVKATLMGDEPEDVSEYHRAHREFPQEPTTDQFFDEAQWESYRRLGQHVGLKVLRPELFDYLRRYPAPRTWGRE